MDNLLKILLFGPPVLFSIVLHEVMHGYVAYLLGDNTAKNQGRLSWNPIRHLDPVGSIILPLILILSKSGVLFGWAKPVPVNIYNTKNPKQALGLTALAGPMTNLALAVASTFVIRVFNMKMDIVNYLHTGDLHNPLAPLLFMLLAINVGLFTFNLIPIPPLDGSKVLMWLLPNEQAQAFAKLEPFGMFILMAVMVFDPLGIVSGLIFTVLRFFIGLL